jgi:two-component system, cell cycle sensor histidine kinase and response regulator CckA
VSTRILESCREAEATLRKQASALDLLFQSAPIGLALLDHQLRYLTANEILAAWHGIAPAEFAGRPLQGIVSGWHESVATRFQETLREGKPVLNIDLTLLCAVPPYSAHHFLAHLFPLHSEADQTLAAGLAMVDVTERKHAEEMLRNSEARYRDTVEHSVYGVCMVNASGQATTANAAMQRILGCTSLEELNEVNFLRDVFRYSDQQAQLFAACRKDGSVQNAETEWKRRDGGIVSIRLHLRQITDEINQDEIEILAEDVTELRALERQLHQAQKFEAIGQLAGGIAHDFNNVIGAILGWAEIGFEQSREDAKAAERFSRIREQGERAAGLTRELLAFARRQVLQPRAMDLNSVVNGLMTFLDRVIGRDIVLEVRTLPLDPIKADLTQVEQVLMNLCINARDAMPNGGRLLIETGMVGVDGSYTRFYPGVAAGRYAVLSVSDTGTGMDAATLERIFEPFFTTKEKGKGTGLGLATVYGIVKQHGGFLHVYSEPCQGSLFRVYFQTMPGGVIEAKVPVPSVGEMRGTETVLIADDHESIREMARQTLASLGYRILCAADGEEALRLCEQNTPDIAVLDVVMPKLGGLATAERLLNQLPELPLIFTSGYSHDHDVRTADLPMASYLQKPYSPTHLGRRVRDILDGKKKQSEQKTGSLRRDLET